MNIKQANNLDFQDLLSKLGHEPVKIRKEGKDLWYYSPFRKETEPSFHIREGRVYNWVWYDFGHEGASTILDFIMQYKKVDKREALAFLDTLYPNFKSSKSKQKIQESNSVPFLFPTQIHQQKKEVHEFKFIQDLPIKSKLILNYLETRKISPVIALSYFRLVKYVHRKKSPQKAYFGFGMKNISYGWEVRSASDREGEKFKTALIAKDISVVKGIGQGRAAVNVFEGMMDFVSLLSMFGVTALRGDSIILHGLKLYDRATTHIQKSNYSRINIFLDNNKPGNETSEKFINDFGDRVINQSPCFAPHEDLNDALIAGFIPTFKRAQ